MQTSLTPTCPACRSAQVATVMNMPHAPVHVGVLWPDQAAARNCPRGKIALAFCRHCGFLFNASFDPDLVDYELSYDNALHFSPLFQQYERDLAGRLVGRYGLRGAEISEIGCGTAHFLGLLCQLSDSHGTGYDPSHDPEHLDELAVGRVKVEREYFSERHADRAGDLLCCRHVLEHLDEPLGLLAMLRRALEGHPKTVMYFEVPNALLAVRQLSIWDIIYEHCGYYTTPSLRRLFAASGFEVLDLYEAYAGQFLGLEARPAAVLAQHPPVEAEGLERLAVDVTAFAEHFHRISAEWQERLEDLHRRGSRVAVWGAGAKTVSFMNLLSGAAEIACVVDINPRKQGMYLAGSGTPIVAPECLERNPPDAIIVMNPIYREEIGAKVRRMGLDAEIISV